MMIGLIKDLKRNIVLNNLDNFKHLAIILDSENNILTVGFNDLTIHAEDRAIRNIILLMSRGKIKERNIRRLKMYVFRVSSQGMLLSMPCKKCQKIINNYEYLFNKIYYSISNNEIGRYL